MECFLGEPHSQNFASRCYGPDQSAQGAEVLAIWHVARTTWKPTTFIIDCAILKGPSASGGPFDELSLLEQLSSA